MESSGIYNQNQVISNVNAKLNAGLSLFGFYVYNHARSNTDGIGTFPANPYNFAGEYGPASTDVHHRFTVGGSINLKWAVRISPFVVAQTGAPFDITAGQRPVRHDAVQRTAGHRDRSDEAGPDPDGVRAAGSEPHAGRAVAGAQLRTRSGTVQCESADRQDDRFRQGARRSGRAASGRLRRAGRGAGGGERPRVWAG